MYTHRLGNAEGVDASMALGNIAEVNMSAISLTAGATQQWDAVTEPERLHILSCCLCYQTCLEL